VLKFLASLIFIFYCSLAHAVCDATLTVCASGCDYDVLNDAVTDLETNCASPTSPLSIEITSSLTDTTAVAISGITTDATNTLTIFTSGNARHNGTSASGYKLSVTNGTAITIASDYVTIDGLILNNVGSNSNGDGRYGVYINTVTGCVIKNNVAFFSGTVASTSDSWAGIYANHTTQATRTYYIYNNIVYGYQGSGGTGWRGIAIDMGLNYSGKTIYLYGNTVYDCQHYGIFLTTRNTNSVYMANNISVDNTNVDFGEGTYAPTYAVEDYNLSSDLTASGANSLTEVPASDLFTSITGGSEDLRLKAGADAIDQGTDLGSPYNVDIKGTSRTGTWDIGADEYVSAGTPTGFQTTMKGYW